jgi:hypothetical protein
MRITDVGGQVKLLGAAEALEIDAASDGPFSADSRNTPRPLRRFARLGYA